MFMEMPVMVTLRQSVDAVLSFSPRHHMIIALEDIS